MLSPVPSPGRALCLVQAEAYGGVTGASAATALARDDIARRVGRALERSNPPADQRGMSPWDRKRTPDRRSSRDRGRGGAQQRAPTPSALTRRSAEERRDITSLACKHGPLGSNYTAKELTTDSLYALHIAAKEYLKAATTAHLLYLSITAHLDDCLGGAGSHLHSSSASEGTVLFASGICAKNVDFRTSTFECRRSNVDV